MGILLVLDGLDGSGKSTQATLLQQRLTESFGKTRLISYPDYEKPSSTLVRMYLNGELAANASEVNAYAASSFYAVDRYASYRQDWKDAYEAGEIILASRYVSSNAIHQMGKLPQTEWEGFLDWLSDYEYDKLGLPRPDGIFFLDMPRTVADRLILSRYGGDEGKKDLHERDRTYLSRCAASAAFAAKVQGWQVIPCAAGDEALPVAAISDALFAGAAAIIRAKRGENQAKPAPLGL